MESFLKGFPVTDFLEGYGTGTFIPGGPKTHGKPANGSQPDINVLKQKCRQVNEETIRKATARANDNKKDPHVDIAMWEKIQEDMEN